MGFGVLLADVEDVKWAEHMWVEAVDVWWRVDGGWSAEGLWVDRAAENV